MVGVSRVSGSTEPAKLAGSIAIAIRTEGELRLEAIGAAAVNQAIKAMAICRGMLAPQGLDLRCVPAFRDIQIDGEERTSVVLRVLAHHL